MATLEAVIAQCADEKEQDLLNILMESTLYLELTQEERYMLLRHIADFYRTLTLCMPTEH